MEKLMKPLLEIRQLSGGYKVFRLKEITFSLQRGDFAGIIGPNGSGKSTLLKTILGDVKRGGGAILLEGEEIDDISIKERAQNIAVVTQHIEATSLSVLEYVLLGRLPYRKPFHFFETKEDVAKAEKYIELTGISKYRDQPLSSLSGGERQLAAMARALAQEPKLLLLDEPTSQLDICHQVQILDLVHRLIDELGLTVMMIMHDLNLAGSYCNRLLLMNEGNLYKQGTPVEVLRYDIIEEVYGTTVVTQNNPITGQPAVFLVPGRNSKASSVISGLDNFGDM